MFYSPSDFTKKKNVTNVFHLVLINRPLSFPFSSCLFERNARNENNQSRFSKAGAAYIPRTRTLVNWGNSLHNTTQHDTMWRKCISLANQPHYLDKTCAQKIRKCLCLIHHSHVSLFGMFMKDLVYVTFTVGTVLSNLTVCFVSNLATHMFWLSAIWLAIRGLRSNYQSHCR